MTERLYYADAYLSSFQARVVERVEVRDQLAVVLDRTAFYPEGGGQPADRGTLNHVEVRDVQIRESDGEVLHFLAAPLAEEEVSGTVDPARRFDLMQQHTGQHILSQSFMHTAGAETVSFHLNPDPQQGALTIDLNRPALTATEIERAEDFANTIVFENRPVVARFVSREELHTLPLRKPPVVAGDIRIVEIESFDWSACGGTHVARTGEVGLIKIIKVDRRNTETRVEFRCGQRALLDYRRKHQVLSQAAAELSIGFWELDQAIGRLQGEAKAVRKQLAEAEARLQQYEAQELLNTLEARGEFGLIVHAWLDHDAAVLKRMANLLVVRPKTVALLGATGQSLVLVFARSKDVQIDLGALLKTAAARLGGKGGGSPDFAQAGGAAVSEAQLIEVLQWVRDQLP